MMQITGNTIWGHVISNNLQNTNIRVINNYCEDTGLDCIQLAGVNGGVVSGNVGRRIGYVAYNPSNPAQDQPFGTPAWIPLTPFSIPAVFIDTSGIVTNVDYTDNTADSINGGFVDGDGYGQGTIRPGVGTSCFTSVDPHAQASLCGPGGNGQNVAYGVNMGNSAASPRVDNFVNILGGTFNGFGGGAIKIYGCSSCKVSNAVINHPNNAQYSPITYGPFTIGSTTIRATNSEISNNTIYWSPATGAMVAEDPQYAAFIASDRNTVHDNRCMGTSGNACYELAKVPIDSTSSGPFRQSSVTTGACPFPSFTPGPTGQSNCIIESILQTEGTDNNSWSFNLYSDIGGTGNLEFSCNKPFGCNFLKPLTTTGLSVTGGVTLSGLSAGAGGTPLCLVGTTVTLGGCGGGGGGGLADPGANGPVYRTALNVTAVATGAQLASVFSGCSSGTPLLSYTGACVAGGGGGGGTADYVTTATTPAGQVITAATHGQGTNPVTFCYSGPVVVSGGNNVATGQQVLCTNSKDSSGNGTVTVSWGGSSVGSIQIKSGISSGGGGGGGGTIPTTTNILSGDGAGNAANSGIAPGNVIQSTGSYANPTWITSLAYSKLTGVPVFQTAGVNNISQSILNIVAGSNVTVSNASGGTVTISSTGGGGGTGAGSFFFNATGSPQTIPATSIGGATNATVWCFDTALSSGNTNGTWTACGWSKTVTGDLTISYTSSVQSIQVDTGGGSGSGNPPYETNATGSPQTISAATHAQGPYPKVVCRSAALSSSNSNGDEVSCANNKAPNGDLIVYYTSAVASIEVFGSSGSGGSGGSSAFGSLTSGTNTGAAMVVGSGASLSATGSGAIAATTAVAFASSPTGCTNQWMTSIAANGNAICSNITRLNGVLLSGLTTGILKNTTGTGVPSIAVSGTDYAPATIGTNILKGNGAGGFGNASAADVALLGTLSNNTSGTAAALGSTPTLCSTGFAPTGILANGNATGCAAIGGGGGGVSSFNTRTGAVTLTASDVNAVGNISNNTSGASSFTFAFSVTPTLCSTGFAPTGILANGNATGCAAVTGGGVSSFNTRTGAVTLLVGDVNALGTITNSTSGNAATSTAFASTPTLCSSGFAPTGILANGNATGCAAISGGSGVTSVGLSMPGIFAVGGSPVTSSGTLSVTLNNQLANTFFRGPAAGIAATPTFGAIVPADLSGVLASADIRSFGAVCNGSDQNTAVQLALTAGKTNIFIPAGCNWTLPSSSYTYNPGTGAVVVPGNAIPPGLVIYGGDWVTSVIQTASPASTDMLIGGQTNVYNMNLKSHACAPWDQNSQSFISGLDCPNQVLTNGAQVFTGAGTGSGTSFTWVSGSKFNSVPSNGSSGSTGGSSWVGRNIVINGTLYTVTAVGSPSGLITTTLTVNTTISGCGTPCNYSFPDYYPFVSSGYQPLTYSTGGPGDFAGIQAVSHGAGDAIFAAADETNGTGVRVGLYGNANIGFLVQKFNSRIAFSVVDSFQSPFNNTGGNGYDYFTTFKQTGPFFSATQTTSSYSGDAFTFDLAAGSGAFTGNFVRFTNGLTPKFVVNNQGNTTLGQLQINDSSNILLFGAIPGSGSGTGGYLCRDAISGRVYTKSSCP